MTDISRFFANLWEGVLMGSCHFFRVIFWALNFQMLAKLGVWVQIYPVHLGHKHQGFRITDLAILIDLRMCVDARSGVQIWAEDIWAYKIKPNNVQINNDCAAVLTCSVWSWPRLNFVRFSFPMAKFLPGSGYHDEEWHHQDRHQTSTINPSHLHTRCRQGFCLCSFPFIVQWHRGAGLSVGLHLSKSQRRNPHKLNPLVYTLHCCCWSRNVNQTLVWHRLVH